MAQKPTIDHPTYAGIPKDIALYIETEALKFNSMRGVARKSAVGLYTKLMDEYRDFANYLIGMYGQTNTAQEKKIAELTQYNQEMATKLGEYKQVQVNTSGKIIELEKQIQEKDRRIETLQEQVKLFTKRLNISRPTLDPLVDPDAAPITMVRRMAIKVVERADGTSKVSHESTDMPMMIAIGILDTLRVKFVTVAAKMFTEIKDPA